MVNQVIQLPAITVQKKTAWGYISHVIESGRPSEVIEVCEIQVSPRKSRIVYTLENGEKVMIADSKSISPPPGINGVLRVQDDGTFSWEFHEKIQALEERIAADGWTSIREEVLQLWNNAFNYRKEIRDAHGDIVSLGLRPPQIGALHAIAAHWSLYNNPATVVMPTGTGKTETMLAALVTEAKGLVIVAVPTRALREQTVKKFLTLGLLRKLGCLNERVANPVVGIVERRPKTAEDLKIFQQCNVVVGTIGSLAQGEAKNFAQDMAEYSDALIVDEAHHIAAKSWMEFRDEFKARRVLQFTATPHRDDGLLVDGEVVYTYPLGTAQKDGYFKPINFFPVHEIDEVDGDEAIAKTAVDKLRGDLANGLDHLIMARCDNTERADALFPLYLAKAAEYNPVIIHSRSKDAQENLRKLQARESRIAICVDMLGEGFDLPQLKIAAVHDVHKSLSVLLQFAGRFTRVAGSDVGEATVIANIANQEVSGALDRLYSEDADWNKLLKELSSTAVREHAELIEFLNSSHRIDEAAENDAAEISKNLLRPKFSVLVYQVSDFQPRNFHKAFTDGKDVRAVWIHESMQTLYFVTRDEPSVEWTRSKDLKDRQWNLFVLHHDEQNGLLYLHSSDKSSLHERLVKAVCGDGARLITGDDVFRVLGGINRLMFQMLGIKKFGRRNLRFAMYTGADVKAALSSTVEGTNSVKSNVSGSGWEDGQPVRIGCSAKGRVWTVDAGTIPEFIKWCVSVGRKLNDSSINTADIIGNVLVPTEITALPDSSILSVEWPDEILRQSEERVVLTWGDRELSLWAFELAFDDSSRTGNSFEFSVRSEEVAAKYVFELATSTTEPFRVRHVNGQEFGIKIGRIQSSLADFFNDYPPLVRFVNLSEMNGSLLFAPENIQEPVIGDEHFEVWNWDETNIKVESLWRDGERRENSIQERVADHYIANGFEVVFDDDDAGEAADLVCLKEEDDCIRLALIHCKFSHGASVGTRVSDVVEVAAQASRSEKRVYKFKELCRHLLRRNKEMPRPNGFSRFLKGNDRIVSRFEKLSRFKTVAAEIVIVQPGLSFSRRTHDQTVVLAAAQSFLKQTVDVDLEIICNI